jgi:hypothetical protein
MKEEKIWFRVPEFLHTDPSLAICHTHYCQHVRERHSVLEDNIFLDAARTMSAGDLGDDWHATVLAVLLHCGERPEVASNWHLLQNHVDHIWDHAFVSVFTTAWVVHQQRHGLSPSDVRICLCCLL